MIAHLSARMPQSLTDLKGLGAHGRSLDVASQQHGVPARSQLLAMGIGEGLIERWLEVRRLHPVFPGAYGVGRPAGTCRAVWMAATLCAGTAAVLTGRSAAAAWGLLEADPRVEVGRSKGRTRPTRGIGSHSRFHLMVRKESLISEDVTRPGPIAVTNVARTLIRLSRDSRIGEAGKREFRRAFLEAGRTGLLTAGCLEYCRWRGRSFGGRRNLLELIDVWSPDTGKIRSVLEGEFKVLCLKAGIPRPETNQWVCGYEVDCLWPEQGLIVELDGRRFHDDGVAFETDRTKGNVLTGAGYTVLRFTYRTVTDHPGAVVEAVRAALGTPGPGL